MAWRSGKAFDHQIEPFASVPYLGETAPLSQGGQNTRCEPLQTRPREFKRTPPNSPTSSTPPPSWLRQLSAPQVGDRPGGAQRYLHDTQLNDRCQAGKKRVGGLRGFTRTPWASSYGTHLHTVYMEYSERFSYTPEPPG